MKRQLILTVCLFGFLLFSLNAQADGPDYSVKNLANGTRIVYKVIPQAKTVNIRIVLPVGFVNESHQLRGISHLLEHLIYRGSERISREQFHSLITYRGGSYNGFTMMNRTEYILEVTPENLESSLQAYLELILFPGLAETNIVLEKRVVTVEKAMRTIPGNTFFLYLNELTEKQFDDSVKNISRDDLLKYHQQFYQPENMIVIVTGAFKAKELAELISKYPDSGLKETSEQLNELRIKGPGSEVVLEDYLLGEQYQLLYGFNLQELSGKDLAIAKVLPLILNYESRQYDYINNRPLDYQIFLYNLAGDNMLIFQYRDCLAPYSSEIENWHQKNLARFFKYLGAKKFDKFLNYIVKYFDKYFEAVELDSGALNDYLDQYLFEPTAITEKDLSAIKNLSSSDFKKFVEKYLDGKKYQKIIVKAL